MRMAGLVQAVILLALPGSVFDGQLTVSTSHHRLMHELWLHQTDVMFYDVLDVVALVDPVHATPFGPQIAVPKAPL